MIPRLGQRIIALCCMVLLAGCYQQQQTVTVHDDGRAEMTLLVTFPGEMKDVAAALQARAALTPQLADFNLENGICRALNELPVSDSNLRVRAREIVSSESYTCRVDVAINDFPAAIAQSGPVAAIAGLTEAGERTFRYQMETMPLALGELAWRGHVRQQLAKTGRPVTSEQVNAIVASDKAGLRALAAMMFRGATSTITIRAPEIVETNGVISDDRTSVSFKTDVSDAVALLMEPGSADTPFIVFRY